MEQIGYRLYLMHAGFCLCSFLLVYYCYPETAGKSLEEMDVVFGDALPLEDEEDDSDDEDEDDQEEAGRGGGPGGNAARPLMIGPGADAGSTSGSGRGWGPSGAKSQYQQVQQTE